jgi:HMG (high mobility group) box
MNRQEQVIYNNDQNAATTEANESGDDDFMVTSDKLFATLGNPIVLPNSIPNVNIHSTMTSTSLKRPPIKTNSSGDNDANQGESPMPKRNLSAYNLFFQVERENIINGEEGMNYTHENIARVALRHYQQSKMKLPRRKHRKTHGKITFAELARAIANKWKALDPTVKEMFVHRTNIEKARYQSEIAEWADKKLRAKPPSPQRVEQNDKVNYVDVLKPDIVSFTDWGTSGTGPSAAHPADMITPHEAIMPHRVFAPSIPAQIIQSQYVAQGIGGANMSNVDSASFGATTLDMGWSNSNNFQNISLPQSMECVSNRPGNSLGSECGGNIQQYQQFNFSPIPVANMMTLQQQLNMMVGMQGSSYAQGQTYSPSSYNYQSYPPMRSMSHPPEQMSPLRSEAVAPLPNETYVSNEVFQPSVTYEQNNSTTSNRGRPNMIGQSQMRYDGNFLFDENENNDNQFNRFDGN